MPSFQYRSTSPASPHIIEPNTTNASHTYIQPSRAPRPPPKDPTSAPSTLSASTKTGNGIGTGGPLRSSTSYSALSVPDRSTPQGSYLRPSSAYTIPHASSTYEPQLQKPAAYRSNSARSSTLGAPVGPVKRSTSPFTDPPDDAELADALRDSVIIGSDNSHHYDHSNTNNNNSNHNSVRSKSSQLIDLDEDYHNHHPAVSTGRANKTTGVPTTNMPHAYSQSTSGLPNAPSANMAAERERSAVKARTGVQNPFEADEIDPAELEGGKQPARVKFGRAHTR